MTDAAAAAAKKPAEWSTPFVAQMSITMPNGGTVTMRAPAASSFVEGIEKLEVTHAQYLEFGGWGGGRAIALFFAVQPLLHGLGVV